MTKTKDKTVRLTAPQAELLERLTAPDPYAWRGVHSIPGRRLATRMVKMGLLESQQVQLVPGPASTLHRPSAAGREALSTYLASKGK